MVKFLLLVLVGVLLYLALTRSKRKPSERPEPRTEEAMVRCAHCGVHVPLGDSLSAGDKRYCCEEHRRLGQ